MIKINLLGKKKEAGPFGIYEQLEKAGIKPEQLSELQPGLLKVGIALIGLYAADYVPTEILQKKIQEVDVKIAAIQEQSGALQKELNSKKEIRKQMDQLNKEEVELQRQLNAVNGLSKDRATAFKTLDTISTILPQKVWLNKIEFNDHRLMIDGASWEYFTINDFIKSLNETTDFFNISFKGINTENPPKFLPGIPAAAQKTKTFQVELQVKESS